MFEPSTKAKESWNRSEKVSPEAATLLAKKKNFFQFRLTSHQKSPGDSAVFCPSQPFSAASIWSPVQAAIGQLSRFRLGRARRNSDCSIVFRGS